MHIFDLPIRNTLENACFEELANLRRIGALRTIGAFEQLADLITNFVFFTKKNKMKNFPTKMKGKIGAPKGRQLYGAPKWALIVPNTVNHLFLAST